MNIRQKNFLYESIMKTVSKTVKKTLLETMDDDDFFSDLGYDVEKEITFLVDDNIYPKNVKNLGTNPSLKDIENIDHIGAILSNDNGYWLLWNLNNEYWDPFDTVSHKPSRSFGKYIAMCVGKGMFAKMNWTGLTKGYSWDNPNLKIDPIYNTIHKVNVNGSGYDSTMNIINNYREYIQDTIWQHLVDESTNEYLLYLPNKEELKTIYNNVGDCKKYRNTNIYKSFRFITNNYWTSSLYEGFCANAYTIYFFHSSMFRPIHNDRKTVKYYSIALIHF